MEGYTDVTGNLDSFDDLDIEGKSTSDDWNAKEDLTFKIQNPKLQYSDKVFDEKALLSEKVVLSDGSQGYCYTVKEHERVSRWTCHICNIVISGTKNFQAHIVGKKHEANLHVGHHNRANFTKILNKKDVDKLQLAPGEPVPPGFEDEVEAVLQIQSTLDNYKIHPLIGLEYLVELVDSSKEPQYNCMLCNKKGDPRTVMAHLTSHNHRLNYIEKHFTLTFNAINNLPKTLGAKKGVIEIVNRISSKIEEKYGRLPPIIADADSFEDKRDSIMAQIEKGSHFNEAPEDVFVDLVDKNLLTIGLKAEEVPPPEVKPPPEPEEDDEVEFQGAFIKGTRVAVDRSALRVRKIEDMLETVQEKKRVEPVKKKPDTKKKTADPTKSVSPFSSISSSSSGSLRSIRRNRSRSRSRSRSTSRRRLQSRSRSRSRNRSHRPRYSRRSRSVSRSRRRRISRTRSRSRSRRRSRSGSRSRRQRSPYNSYRSSRTNRSRPYSEHKKDDKKEKSEDLTTEKAKWERFREDVDKVEKDLRDLLKYHEKNPEKHPQYPEEWKLFWNRRYKELQSIGVDPSKHDFKPEWINFWNKRMRELHEAEFTKKKEEISERLGLPPENPDPSKTSFRRKRPAPLEPADQLEPISPDEDKRDPVAEMKNTWKAFTGSDIRESKVRSRSPSPWEESLGRSRLSPDARRAPKESRLSKEREFGSASRYRREPLRPHNDNIRTISVLRTLTALENQLGSLGPKVNTLLSEAIALDKIHSGNSDAILANDQNCVLFETIKEKLKGQLYAGIIDRNMVAPTKSAIQSISELLSKAPLLLENIKPVAAKRPMMEPLSVLTPVVAPPIVEEPVIVSEPVTVPGIGAVDKVAIAQQIAAALVAQGKTDVTQEELEQLINAVVGMAQASVDAQEPISTADFVNSLTKSAEAAAPVTPVPPVAPAAPAVNSPLEDSVESITMDESSRGLATPTDDIRSVSSEKLGRSSVLDGPQTSLDGIEMRPVVSSNAPSAIPNSSSFTVTSASSFVSKSSISSIGVSPPSVLSSAGATTTVTTSATETRIADRPANASPSQGVAKPPPLVTASRLTKSGYGHEDLTEDDLKTLLQNFKDLSTEEQHGLILYLKKLEATDMDRVEKLRKFVNLGPSSAVVPPATRPVPTVATTVKKVETVATATTTAATSSSRNDSGPLSPFSLRQGGANPTRDLESKRASNESLGAKLMDLDDSDDDYTFEDVYAAASQKVKERMAEEEKKAKEKMAEEARLREERERERLQSEEQDKIEREERDRREKEGREKWEAGNAANNAAVLAASQAVTPTSQIPAISMSQTDPTILLKQTTEVLDDLMGNLPSRFNKQMAAAAAAAAAATQSASPITSFSNAQSQPASQSQAPMGMETVSSYSNYYNNASYGQPPPATSNGYNYYGNDQYRQLSYPTTQGQDQSNLGSMSNQVNQAPVPNQMSLPGQNPYPPMHGGYYPNQQTGMYHGSDYQNAPNYQNTGGNYQSTANYNNPQQMYGQGYGQQMYPQQPAPYGQYNNQRSYY